MWYKDSKIKIRKFLREFGISDIDLLFKLKLADKMGQSNNNLEELEEIKRVRDLYLEIANSNDLCIPHIINISIEGIKPETMIHALAECDIYISTKTACSYDNYMSLSVFELTKDKNFLSFNALI